MINADTWNDAVKELAIEWQAQQTTISKHERVMADDSYMAEWRREQRMPPLGRIKDYSNQPPPYRWIMGFGQIEPYENIPVIAAGALYSLYRKYSNSYYGAAPNGWCERVADRYLQYIKYTCFDVNDHFDFIGDIRCRLCDKHGVNWKSGQANEYALSFNGCYINGNRKYNLTDHQLTYIKKLWRISKGMEKLELTKKRVKLP
ncbi:MAG: hypothetical protein GY938_06270 [Ketobacter sp.]|nr:hypothetical protein [Ketobacter sp.]